MIFDDGERKVAISYSDHTMWWALHFNGWQVRKVLLFDNYDEAVRIYERLRDISFEEFCMKAMHGENIFR